MWNLYLPYFGGNIYGNITDTLTIYVHSCFSRVIVTVFKFGFYSRLACCWSRPKTLRRTTWTGEQTMWVRHPFWTLPRRHIDIAKNVPWHFIFWHMTRDVITCDFREQHGCFALRLNAKMTHKLLARYSRQAYDTREGCGEVVVDTPKPETTTWPQMHGFAWLACRSDRFET